jgi:hypothetical protein
VTRAGLAGAVALAFAAGQCAPAAAAPASASGSDQPAAKRCVTAEEAAARTAGEDEDAPPKFTRAFYAHTFTLDASLDGLDGTQLPISIEEVCGVPRKLKSQAAQLAGGDGIALIATGTQVWQDGTRLSGEAATTALDGADTALLRVRLTRPRRWREDEDGTKVATFRTRRVTITD